MEQDFKQKNCICEYEINVYNSKIRRVLNFPFKKIKGFIETYNINNEEITKMNNLLMDIIINILSMHKYTFIKWVEILKKDFEEINYDVWFFKKFPFIRFLFNVDIKEFESQFEYLLLHYYYHNNYFIVDYWQLFNIYNYLKTYSTKTLFIKSTYSLLYELEVLMFKQKNLKILYNEKIMKFLYEFITQMNFNTFYRNVIYSMFQSLIQGFIKDDLLLEVKMLKELLDELFQNLISDYRYSIVDKSGNMLYFIDTDPTILFKLKDKVETLDLQVFMNDETEIRKDFLFNLKPVFDKIIFDLSDLTYYKSLSYNISGNIIDILPSLK